MTAMTNYKVNVELNEMGAMIAGKKTRTIDIQNAQDNLDMLAGAMEQVVDQSPMGPYVKAIRSIKRHFTFEQGALFIVIFPNGIRHLARCVYAGGYGIVEVTDCGMRVSFHQDGTFIGLANSPYPIEDPSMLRLTMPTEEEIMEFGRRAQDHAGAPELIDLIFCMAGLDEIDMEKIQCKVYSMEPHQIKNYLKKFRAVQSLVHDIMEEGDE